MFNSSLCVAFPVSLFRFCPVPDLSTVSPVLNPWSFQVFSMFHGSLSGCEQNTRAQVTGFLDSSCLGQVLPQF